MRQISRVSYVLDEFHLEKYIKKLTSHMKDSRGDAAEELRKIIRRGTKKEFIELTGRLALYLEGDEGLFLCEKE